MSMAEATASSVIQMINENNYVDGDRLPPERVDAGDPAERCALVPVVRLEEPEARSYDPAPRLDEPVRREPFPPVRGALRYAEEEPRAADEPRAAERPPEKSCI